MCSPTRPKCLTKRQASPLSQPVNLLVLGGLIVDRSTNSRVQRLIHHRVSAHRFSPLSHKMSSGEASGPVPSETGSRTPAEGGEHEEIHCLRGRASSSFEGEIPWQLSDFEGGLTESEELFLRALVAR